MVLLIRGSLLNSLAVLKDIRISNSSRQSLPNSISLIIKPIFTGLEELLHFQGLEKAHQVDQALISTGHHLNLACIITDKLIPHPSEVSLPAIDQILLRIISLRKRRWKLETKHLALQTLNQLNKLEFII